MTQQDALEISKIIRAMKAGFIVIPETISRKTRDELKKLFSIDLDYPIDNVFVTEYGIEKAKEKFNVYKEMYGIE